MTTHHDACPQNPTCICDALREAFTQGVTQGRKDAANAIRDALTHVSPSTSPVYYSTMQTAIAKAQGGTS